MRRIDLNTDYETLSTWWTGYDFPVVPKECLPENGLIIDGLCAGFIYKTDSNIAIMEWIIGNKEADSGARKAALEDLIKSLTDMARSLGYKRVFSMVKHPNLIQLYKENGFLESDTNMTHFVGRLD